MNTLKIAINGPRQDEELGIICTVDLLAYDDDTEDELPGMAKTVFIKTADIYQALKEVAQTAESMLNRQTI